MFRRSRTATPPPPALVLLPAQPFGPIAPASPPFVEDVENYSLSLVREARARYDRLSRIPRSELPDGEARWELLRRALMGQCYDCYTSGGEWYLIVPPSGHQVCFPRTTPALWQFAYDHGTPLAYD